MGRQEGQRLISFFLEEPGSGTRSIAFVRLAVGLIFLTQGILKFTDPRMGVTRFARI